MAAEQEIPVTNKDKERILNYAREKFCSEGFYKTSMDELAKEMQISKKTIYKYYTSKENLVEEIVHTNICMDDSVMSEIIDSNDNVVLKLLKMSNSHLSKSAKISEKWIRDVQTQTPHIYEQIRKFKAQKIESAMIKLISQGVKEELIEKIHPQIVILIMTTVASGVTRSEFLINNNISLHDALKAMFEFVFNGLLTPKGREIFQKEKKNFNRSIQETLISKQ
ncbi:TetR/AcrR family transcriptional regulator [soil metagenome]